MTTKPEKLEPEDAQTENAERARHNQQLVEENRRLVQRCLELESTSRRQLEKLQAANAVLSRGEADLRILLENASVGFALTDLNLRVASANKTLADILGHTQAELAGVNFANFVYVGKLPAFTRLTGHGGLGEAIIELVARDGGLIPCRIAASNWLDANGAAQGHFLLVYDAGPELLAAGRLRETEQMMAEMEKSRTLFLEVVSRELRSPASGVVGMSRMLMDAGLNERQAELAGVIHSSAGSLVRLVDDLVDAANLDSGEARARPEPVDINALTRGVANLFSVRAEEKGLELRVHVASNVPERVMADPHLLRRVLVHLLDNSLKFTERGHASLTVEVVNNRLRFMVSDTGPGVDPGLEEQIFQALPGDTAESRRYGGVGVGLTICRRLVTAMGGKIAYESEVGRGSEFHFAIPLHHAEAQVQPDTVEIPAETVHLPHMEILLADANPLSSKVAQAYLRFDGHKLTVTDNGVDAAEKCRTSRFDLVLLDLNLPKLDGMQTLRLIREDEKNRAGHRAPVLLLASAGQLRQPEYYKRSGADGVVKKPFQPVELMAAAAAATGVKPTSMTRRRSPGSYTARITGGTIRRIDGTQLVNLRQMMLDDQFMGVLRFFMEDAVPGLMKIKVWADREPPERQRLALATNKTRGLASYLGFKGLAELLGRLENAARTEAPDAEIRRVAGELPVVTDDTLEELKRIIPEAFTTMSDMRGPAAGTRKTEKGG